MISRRTLIGGLAALPATAAPACALALPGSPILPEPQLSPAGTPGLRPAEQALHHWREFCAAMGEIDPSVERWLVFGSADPGEAGVRGMRIHREDVGRGIIGDVDRIVYRGSFGGGALWRAEYEA